MELLHKTGQMFSDASAAAGDTRSGVSIGGVEATGAWPPAKPEIDVRAARQIAHGFNNILAVIGGHAEILIEALPSDSPLRRSLTAIQESTTRGAALTQKLFEMARHQQPQAELVDPGRMFLNIEADARRTFGDRVTVAVDARQPLWFVLADSRQMQKATWTIAGYAIDAMPHGGSITLRASNAEVGVQDPHVHAFVKEGRYVRFDIVCSRTIGDAERFTDFAPLRERAARDGVDLALVFGLIKRNGGYLWIGTDESSAETALTMLWPARAEESF